MAGNLDHLDTLGHAILPVRYLGAWQPDTEPLLGHGMPILHAGIADVAARYPGAAREVAGDLVGVETALADAQPHVFTGTGERETQLLADHEILRLGSQQRGHQRRRGRGRE